MDWAAWGIAWGDSWGDAWGPLHAVDTPPAPYATGHNAPPVAQHRKRRGITRRRSKIEEYRILARRLADDDVLLTLM